MGEIVGGKGHHCFASLKGLLGFGLASLLLTLAGCADTDLDFNFGLDWGNKDSPPCGSASYEEREENATRAVVCALQFLFDDATDTLTLEKIDRKGFRWEDFRFRIEDPIRAALNGEPSRGKETEWDTSGAWVLREWAKGSLRMGDEVSFCDAEDPPENDLDLIAFIESKRGSGALQFGTNGFRAC